MKKNYLLFILTLSIFYSCANESSSTLEEAKFDNSVYNERELLYSAMDKIDSKIKEQDVITRSSENSMVLFEECIDYLNEDFGTDLTILQIDIFQIENPGATINDFKLQGFITDTDEEIIETFFTYLDNNNLESSLNLLRNYIINRDISSTEFEKYNNFVNTIMIVNDYYFTKGIDVFAISTENIDTSITTRGRRSMSMGCAVAILANSTATIGLTSCFVPGPLCAVAAIGKGLSLAGIYFGCK